MMPLTAPLPALFSPSQALFQLPVKAPARNWVSPCPELEDYYFPSEGWIIDAIHEKLFPIPGHTPGCNFTEQEELRLEQFGL